ncbi:DDE superfamily endonuclease [Nitzschia inconspicua]|uniref:DDE superfamily endonuclease n=1 Tax=Nitzschia inconspicua TaxID=303405 RepID=A0A9K3KPB8_9STRA|nr:DDE superfamily endonuclease [Nitzschia inconspicua]
MARKRLTNGQKLQIVRDCEQRLANNEPVRSIARSYGLQGKQIRNWRDKQLLLANTKSTKKSTSRGAKGRLQEYEDEIMTWAFYQRDAGVPLAYKHLEELQLASSRRTPTGNKLFFVARRRHGKMGAHWTDDVKERLEEIGITPYKIPPGCTYLVQPLDVGICKPFKDQVRSKWWQWMMDQGADRSTFVSASRELGTKWVSESWEAITEVTIRNAWRKTGLSYFPEEE